eukprot:scaffold54198_cov73-Phaeocystis_antarctica.AAC.1
MRARGRKEVSPDLDGRGLREHSAQDWEGRQIWLASLLPQRLREGRERRFSQFNPGVHRNVLRKVLTDGHPAHLGLPLLHLLGRLGRQIKLLIWLSEDSLLDSTVLIAAARSLFLHWRDCRNLLEGARGSRDRDGRAPSQHQLEGMPLRNALHAETGRWGSIRALHHCQLMNRQRPKQHVANRAKINH